MATQDKKVTAGDVVSATVKYTNKDNADRKFDISADVNISNGKVTNFNNGELRKKDSSEFSNANFNSSGDNAYFNYNCNNLSEEESKEAFVAIYDFISDVNRSVTTKE